MSDTRFALIPQAIVPQSGVYGVNRSGALCEFFDASRKRYWVQAGVPRFDHDPDLGAYLGLKTEAASTNLLLSSNDMSKAAWTRTNISVSSPIGLNNTGLSSGPDGLSMCWTLGNTTNAAHCSEQSGVATTANLDYVYSVELKAKTGNSQQYAQVYLDDGSGNGAYVNVDLTTGAITSLGAGNGAVTIGSNVSNVSAGVIYYRSNFNFWTAGTNAIRVWIRIRHSTATALRGGVAFLATSTGTFKEAHASSSGKQFYIGNSQLEQASAPSSNILNMSAASSASRGAETFTGNLALNIPDLVTNYLTDSNKIDQATWTKTNATVGADAGAGPFSSTLADSLLCTNTASNQHSVFQAAMAPQGTGASSFYSVFLKAKDYSAAVLSVFNGGGDGVNFAVDLTNGAHGLLAASGAGQASNIQVVDCGGGWYQYKIVGLLSGTATVQINVYDTFSNALTQPSWTPSSGFGIWVYNQCLAYDVFDYQYSKIETDTKGPLPAASSAGNPGVSINSGVDPWPWDSGTTYAIGDYVMRPASSWINSDGTTDSNLVPMVYQRKTAGSSATAPEQDPTNWTKAFPVNRWRWFDSSGSSQTLWFGEIIIVNNTNQANCDMVLMDKTTTGVVTAQVRYPNTAYSATKSGVSTVSNWRRSFVFNEVPHVAGNWMEISLQGLAGQSTMGLGTLITGGAKRLGYSQYGAQVGIKDYTKKTTDSFGNTVAVPGEYAKRMNVSVRMANTDVDDVIQLLTNYRATAVAWVAVGDVFTSMAMNGFFNSFEVVISYPTESLCNYVIEGLT